MKTATKAEMLRSLCFMIICFNINNSFRFPRIALSGLLNLPHVVKDMTASKKPIRGRQRMNGVLKGGKNIIPDEVDLFLHVPELGGYGHDGILLGDDDNVLAISAVSAEGVVAAAPHLVAIAL